MNKLDCGHAPEPDILPPGYTIRGDKTRQCITCTADRQVREMMRTGRGKLARDREMMTTIAGLHSFPIVKAEESPHNIAKSRLGVWFIGPDDMRWHGQIYGADRGDPVAVKRCTGLHHLRDQLSAYGVSIYLQGGEYSVNLRYAPRERAYYTTDPVDAFTTGIEMARERDKPKPEPAEKWGA